MNAYRDLSGRHTLLRIFISDFDRFENQSLHRYLLEAARKDSLAGCTVLQGSAGFGERGRIHTDYSMEGAGERPLVIELVDSTDQIRAFSQKIVPALGDALITEEDVEVHYYGPGARSQKSSGPDEGPKMQTTTARNLDGEKKLLRIYLGESDKAGREPLYLAIVKRARELGVAGCTALRGISGFGANSIIHTSSLFRLSPDLPIILEITDDDEKVQSLLTAIQPMLAGSLVTEQTVHVHHYGSSA